MPSDPDYLDDPFELRCDQSTRRERRQLMRSSSGRLRALQQEAQQRARPSERLVQVVPPASRRLPPQPHQVYGSTPPHGLPRPVTPPQGVSRPSSRGLPAVPPPSSRGLPAVPPPSSRRLPPVAPPSSRHLPAVTRARAVTPSRGYPAPDMGATRPTASSRGTGRLEPGGMIDAYQILTVLGRGSMGRVLLARDPLGRKVAIKMILAEVADEEGLIRFQREGQAMAAVPAHPNVVTVHSTGRWQGSPYLVLDYVEGEGLDRRIKAGALPVDEAVPFAERLCAALAHIHAAGVHHRDLKPANVMVRAEDGQPVVADFGMAGLRGADRLTRTGDLLGTPLYMAPEQILGLKDVDGRVDVWALGVLTFELLTGHVPFAGRSLVEVTQAITAQPTPNLLEACPEADAALAAIVGRALAKKAADRYPDPEAFRAALADWLAVRLSQRAAPQRPQPTPHARRLWALTILSLLSAASAVLALTWRKTHPAPVAAAAPSPEASPRRRARRERAEATPAETPAEVEARLGQLQQGLELRLADRLRADARALRMSLQPGVELDPASLAPLVGHALAWLEADLAKLPAGPVPSDRLHLEEGSQPPVVPVIEVEALRTLEAPLLALGLLREAAPGLTLPASSAHLATRIAGIAATQVSHTTSEERLAAPSELFAALGASGLQLEPEDPSRALYLVEFWTSWSFAKSVYPTPLYLQTLRGGVQLDLVPRHNLLYGGNARPVRLADIKQALRGEDPVTRYLDALLQLAIDSEPGVEAHPALQRRLLDLVSAEEQASALGPHNRALAMLTATGAADDAAERTRLVELALATSPEDPWVLRDAASFLAQRRDPRASRLMREALARYQDGGFGQTLATNYEYGTFLERAATCAAVLGDYAETTRLVRALDADETDGDAAGIALTLCVGAFERQELRPALDLLALTEELIAKYKTSWLDSKDRAAFEGWEDSLKQTYREGYKLYVTLERPDLARELVELYRGSGRMQQDNVFLRLAKDMLPADER